MATQTVTQTATVSGSTIRLAPLDVIDYGKVINGDAAENQRLVNAARDVGFFHLDLNGPATQDYLRNLKALYQLQMQYFDQPHEMKMKHNIADSNVEQGYKPMSDCQTFEIPRDVWQQRSVDTVPDALNKPETDGFMQTSTEITDVLLDRMSRGLGLTGADHLSKFHRPSERSGCGLKMESVPTVERLEDVPPSEHTDSGSITLLYCEKYTTQLQVPNGGEWFFIEPKAGCAIVNVADALQKISGGQLKSRLHRVGQPTNGVEQRPCVLYYLRPETATGLYVC